MSFWRRAPRALYRVYDEDEYLAGEDDAAGEIPLHTDARRSSRLLGLGLLACVAASAVGLIALHLFDPRPSSTAPVAVHRSQVGGKGASASTSAAPATPSAPAFALPSPKPIARTPTRVAHAQSIRPARASNRTLERGWRTHLVLSRNGVASTTTTTPTPLITRYSTPEATAENEFGFER